MSPTHYPEPSGPTRVFRADTPQEVASASIVAGALPRGRDILAIYGGASFQPPERALEGLCAMTHAHPWEAVVDLTTLPVKDVSGTSASLRARLARTRATVATVRGMRERFAEILGLEASAVEAALDEVYISVLTAGTMVSAYGLSRSARMCCYPHTLTSVGHEQYQLEFPQPLSGRLADLGKRLFWGPEAVPKRRIHLDLAVTFWHKPDWATETVSLGHLITEPVMRDLFTSLPEPVRGYLQRLAADCPSPTGVLLLESGDAKQGVADQDTIERDAYFRLVENLVQREKLKSLVVKPHPRMPPTKADEVTRALTLGFPQLQVRALEQHPTLPIEVVSVPFDFAACGSIVSTALCTLPLIYALRSYCDGQAAEALYGPRTVGRILTEWSGRVGQLLNVI